MLGAFRVASFAVRTAARSRRDQGQGSAPPAPPARTAKQEAADLARARELVLAYRAYLQATGHGPRPFNPYYRRAS